MARMRFTASTATPALAGAFPVAVRRRRCSAVDTWKEKLVRRDVGRYGRDEDEEGEEDELAQHTRASRAARAAY